VSDEISEKDFAISVHIAKKGQIDGIVDRLQTIGSYVVESVVFEDYDAREMQLLQFAKGNDGILRIHDARFQIHGGEQGTQLNLFARIDRSKDHET
jgi:hypothetical protein